MWAACPHAEWMIWSLEQLSYPEEPNFRLFAAACARRHWHLLTDSRSREAVQAAESFASQKADVYQLRYARMTARAAADEATLDRSWTAASAAAAMIAYETTRSSEFAAAREAGKFGLRIAAWNPKSSIDPDQEDVWQTEQMRRIFAPRLNVILSLAQRKKDSIEQYDA